MPSLGSEPIADTQTTRRTNAYAYLATDHFPQTNAQAQPMDGEIAVAHEDSELVRALKERESLGVIQSIVEARPHVLREWGVDGWLPIHHAISRCNRPEVIRYLLEQWPESIGETLRYDGCYLPMHLACFVAKVDETEEEGEIILQNVQVLYELWPESLQQREEGDGCLPLHLADDARRVRYLVRAWPHAVRERNSKGFPCISPWEIGARSMLSNA
jgi:hypothetical protein